MRPFWFAVLVIAAAGAFGGYYAARWPGFYPKRLIVSGNAIVPAQEIAARAQIAGNANLWLQNFSAAASRIETIPYVKKATITRSASSDVHIWVTERTPYAVLRYGKRSAVIDRDLRVLAWGGDGRRLPQFVLGARAMPAPGEFVNDAFARRLRADYDALAKARVRVASLRYDKFGDLVAGMPSGTRLLLGDDSDLSRKVPLILPILSQVGATGRTVAALDLRAPTTPVVRYRDHP